MAKKNKKKVDWRIVCLGLICITTLEVVALLNGINGTAYTMIIGIIALAIGVTIPNPIETK